MGVEGDGEGTGDCERVHVLQAQTDAANKHVELHARLALQREAHRHQ